MDEIAAKQVLLDFELIALIALALGVMFYAAARRWKREESLESVDYDGYDLILMFFPAVLFLMNPIVEGVMAASNKPIPIKEPENGISSVVMNLGYFAFVGIMTCGIVEWIRNRRVVDLFGLRRLSLPKIVVITILSGVASLLICAWAVGDFSNSYLEGIFGDLEVQEPVKMFQDSSSNLHLALSVLLACVAAPLVEEFLFRGYMYGTLRRLTNPVFAAIIIGALFAVVHGNLPALLPLWVFSILLCLAYELTGCLWVSVGMHIFFNAANIVLMLMPESAE
ncbi:MAG: CPBP family intramembrane metalloprotease [Verrucomicrobiales bacterium]|nr:CPBP family intramembrane metalloprotease [Verrucomicrobiales bacterium]HQW29210.1 type II CAAX endopeptidase family protein [Verrucomicrobiales bacterium]